MNTSTASTTHQDRVDVAVIGCGTTGLALARLLQTEGLSVAVVDRGRLPMARPRATHVDDETMRAFQALGLSELEKDFSLVGTYRHYDARWRTVMAMAMNRGRTEQGWQSDYMFHQPDFESVLRGHLYAYDRADTYFGWDASLVADTGDEVVLNLRETATGQERTVRAGYVVGCDGANSPIREALGCTRTDHHATHRSLIIDIVPLVEKKELTSRDSWIQGAIRNPLTVVPIAAPRVRFELMLRDDDVDAEFERTEKAYEVLAPWIAPHEYRLLRSDVYEWRSLTADTWRAGRVFLAGDAAHTMPPHLGQGMCSGIRDATNLAWKLGRVLRGESAPELLDTYESERRPHVLTYTTVSADLANRIEGLEAPDEEPEVFQATALRPLLGPGVVRDGDPVAGTLSPQPRTTAGGLLDDVVGYRFAVIADPGVLSGVSDATRALLARLDVGVIDDLSKGLRGWLGELEVGAVVVRPDRYLYGTADDAAALDVVLAGLDDALRPARVSARTV